MYHQKMDGFVYYYMTHWPGYTPINPANGAFTNWEYRNAAEKKNYGDGELIYPGTTGPIASIRGDFFDLRYT